jgi:hypothetical protein
VRQLRPLIAALVLVLAVPSAAQAFDTQPHNDITQDAFTAEGATPGSAAIGAVTNWFVDYYTNPDKNPYSGHANALIGVTRLGLARESWPDSWVDAARKLHFDAESRAPGMPNLSNAVGIEREWQRLMFLTRQRLAEASQRNDPLLVLTAIGTSLHAVQDFYSHSSWVEDPSAQPGRGGPGLAGQGLGDTPTWFDVPRTARLGMPVYTGVRGIPRGHGNWRSDSNDALTNGLNKDWSGRPKYREAYLAAFFATRQWIRAARGWLGNDPLWARAMAMPFTSELSHDLRGAEQISAHSGHWLGGGEPCVPFSCGERTGKAGSVVSLRLALGDYHDRGATRYRRAFNATIASWRQYPTEPLDQPDPASTRPEQAGTRFVRLTIPRYDGIDLGDPIGGADVYMRARIRGQAYASTVINGEDSFSFPGVYAPFEWIRSVPTPQAASTPVTTMTVRIETGDRRFAGTDDDISLRVSGRHRFSLDKALYDDFERDDDDTYSVPIDAATRDGLTVGDIDRVVVEKSRDGAAGGWYLGGVTVTVNGRIIATNRRINRWLEDDRRTWTATGITRDHRTSDVVPVWLQLLDDDFGPNDTGDINGYDRRTTAPIAYPLGTVAQAQVTGGHQLRGRLSLDNGDKARLSYRLETLRVNPPPAPAPPVTGPAPDLVVTNLDTRFATVRNQGATAAAPFTVTVAGFGAARVAGGLPPGGSATVQFYAGSACGGDYRAVADSAQEVSESDEANNGRELLGVVC